MSKDNLTVCDSGLEKEIMEEFDKVFDFKSVFGVGSLSEKKIKTFLKQTISKVKEESRKELLEEIIVSFNKIKE